ncbi:MAG: hypothetical protein QOI24_168 [Acidobacteriota bacterium]|jgi:hypothetical protein|nr:hypothetical protein [Acidobacteriota bacterium]
MTEHYQKRGAVIRREGSVLLRISEAGEAIDDGATFIVRPIDSAPIDAPNADAVINVADQLAQLNPERLIVSEGIAHHVCDGREWREESRRVHVALTHERMRVIIDHADLEQLDDISRVAHALRAVRNERAAGRVRLAPSVTAALLPSLLDKVDVEQRSATHDGRGLPVTQRAAAAPHPNVFRPTYRQRPIAMPFNLRAKPFGVMEDAPLAIAIVNGSQLLCVDGSDVFLMPLRIDDIRAVGEPQRWYPYAAGSFGAEMLL